MLPKFTQGQIPLFACPKKKSVDMMQPLIDKARAAIDKVAGQLGFNYVLDSSAGGSVIIAKGKDIMAEVKVELGF